MINDPSCSKDAPDLLEAIFSTFPQGILVLEQDGRVLRANALAVELLRIPTGALSDEVPAWTFRRDGQPLPPQECPPSRARAEGRAVQEEELEWVRPDGTGLWLSVTAAPLAEGRVVVTFRDVTRQVQEDRVLRACARLASRVQELDLTQLLQATLDELEPLTGSRIGFYHLLDEDQDTLRLKAWSTRTLAEFCQVQAFDSHHPVNRAGVWADALRLGRPVVHNDYPDMYGRKGLPEGHAQVLRELVVPILRNGRICALVGVGNKILPYDDADVAITQQLADRLWELVALRIALDAERRPPLASPTGKTLGPSAQKRAEDAFHRSEARLRGITESTQDAILLIDPQGAISFWNPAATAIFGYSEEEALGLDLHALLAPHRFLDDQRRAFAAFNLSGGGAAINRTLELTALRKGGEEFPMELSLSALRQEDGWHAVGIVRDITTRREADLARRASKEMVQRIFEAAPIPIAVSDLTTGQALDANPAFFALSGFLREDLIGRTFSEIGWVSQADRDLVRSTLQSEGRITNLPMVFQARDGHPVYVLYSAEIITIGDRQALLSIGLDITGAQAAQEALRRSESRFRGLFEDSPMPLAVEDFSDVAERFAELRREGVEDLRGHLRSHPHELRALASRVRILDANAAALKLFGASSLEELAQPLLPSGFTEESLGVFQEELAALFEGRPRYSFETRLLDRKGGNLTVERNITVQPGHEEDLGRLIVSYTDLTARHAAEAERQDLERELGHLQRLESLGRLAGGVSHDMNNVLGAIMAVASILKERHEDNHSIVANAEILLQAAIRGRDLVKGLRDFSRKELESATELDLNELANREADLLDRTTLKKVDIALDLCAPLPPVLGDASAISNALMNLCVNACDAMPHGGRLTLITSRLGENFVELAVQDTGEGMSSEVQARALEPFFTTKPLGRGTGLGLSQVYGTMKAHGGTLDIKSRVGKGTRVALVFPVSASAPAGSPSPAPPSFPAPRRRLDILVVDDEELMRCTIELLLRNLEHRVQVATGGLEALRRLEVGMPTDLVLLDVNMPGLDGVETLNRIQMLRPGLPVILTTGYVDERIPGLLQRFPNLRLLCKPFGLPELRQALEPWS